MTDQTDEQKPDPSPTDAAAIGQASAQAAAAASPAERQQAAADAAQATADQRGVKITPEERDEIATAVVGMMETRFDIKQEADAAEEHQEQAGGDPEDQAQQSGSEGADVEAGDGAGIPDFEPNEESWADKFLKKR